MEAVRKHSYKRDAILNCLRTTTCHPTAEWVYTQLKPTIPDLSLGTVYRNLAQFKEEGLIDCVDSPDTQEHFDGCTAPHAHVVCSGCGRILDCFDLELPASLTAFLQSEK